MEVTNKLICVNNNLLGDNDVAPKLVVGEEYELKEIILDSKGNQHFDVGLKSKYNYIRSIETGEDLPRGKEIHWCHPSRFKLKEA